MNALKQGNKAMLNGNEIVAMANSGAHSSTIHQRLCAATAAGFHPEENSGPSGELSSNRAIQLQPTAPHQDFHFAETPASAHAGGTRLRHHGQFDDSVQQRRVTSIFKTELRHRMEAATR